MTPAMASTYDAGAALYDRFTGQWSRLYVPCLVAAAEVAGGHSVLDVAAGTGEATVGLASRVGVTGLVVAVDLSLPMLSVAAAKLAGLRARVVVMDGQGLACRDRSFDAVVCQLGLMFFPAPLRGLEECRRVLRPGGRVALLVWSRPERVPFYGFLADALSRHLPPVQHDALYLPSALADADRLRELLTRAGFHEVSVTPERRSRAFESFEDYWEAIGAGAGRLGPFYLGLPETQRCAVREEVQGRMAPFRSDTGLVLEAEALIARGVNRERARAGQ
jgi:ubiquinone/menaquinone biosynthesis C-methylase UbiE